MRAQAVHDCLIAHSYRNTRTRDAVIGFLAEQRYLISVEQISDAVTVDPVTVYRVLDVLEQLGIVRKIQSDASYVTIPQSLWDEQSLAVLIDDQRQRLMIRPYTSPRDDITPTKTVVEIWGHIHTHTTTHSITQDIHKPTESQNQQGEEKDNGSEAFTPPPSEEVHISSTEIPTQDMALDPNDVDRLHRF